MTIKMRFRWQKIRQFIFDTIFPIECLGCRTEGKWLCDECLIKIRPDVHSLSGVSLDRILTFYSYDSEVLKKAIHLLKYKFIEDLVEPLGKLFVIELNKIRKQFGREVVLVPVPLHKKRFLERGFNQAELLALKLKDKFGWQIATRVLKRTRFTLPQVDLKEEERMQNVYGAFTLLDASKVKNKKIVLIDDVLTTGATMEECARILKMNGAKEVWGVALAKG